MGKPYLLLGFGSIDVPSSKRGKVVFKASRRLTPRAPLDRVALRAEGIKVAYVVGERILPKAVYVVYEPKDAEERRLLKHYLAPRLPKDAQLLKEYAVNVPVCPRCGAVAEVSGDEMFCPRCGEEGFWNVRKEVLFRSDEGSFTDGDVLKAGEEGPEPEEPVISSENIEDAAREWLRKNGYETEYGRLQTDRDDDYMLALEAEDAVIGKDVEGREVKGTFIKGMDNLTGKTGLFFVVTVASPYRATYVFKLKGHELTPEEETALLLKYPNDAPRLCEALPPERVAEALRKDKTGELLKTLASRAGTYESIAKALRKAAELDAGLREAVAGAAIEVLKARIRNAYEPSEAILKPYEGILPEDALAGLRELIRKERERREAERREREEELRRKALEELGNAMRDWCDAVYYDGRKLVPVKKSKYRPNEYYYKKSWRAFKAGDISRLLGPDALIITKEGKAYAAMEPRTTSKYVTIPAGQPKPLPITATPNRPQPAGKRRRLGGKRTVTRA